MAIPIHTQTLIEKIQSLPIDRIAEVEDFVDFLKLRTQTKKITEQEAFDFPVMSVVKWSDDLSLLREDMHGNNGR